MPTTRGRPLALLFGILAPILVGGSAVGADDEAEKRPLGEYFKAETAKLAQHPLLDIDSADAWKTRRPELKRQLLEMLGLDPMPERTDLRAEVRGVVERPDFVVEKILFQSSPELYVTADLYRPKKVDKPLPAILYVCGHAKVEKDGVIYGNKSHYQHHAAWFASNGYVCLVVDTLQLGEIPGLHHGTYRFGMWWWMSRGYTPAGVEVWNGIRAIDYLVSRPEVDPNRLGVTGRSGGGAMSWYLGAVEDRLKAVVPVAGITDLQDHVVAGNPKVAHPHGVVEGHCDCMFFVNTHRWDHTMVAALVAPKALLFVNTNVDPIFPEVGVRRIFKQLETVYPWYDAREKLGLVIGDGGHKDTEEIRHPAFAWFDRWLKDKPDAKAADIDEPDRSIPVEELKVLDPKQPLPANRNATIHETFIASADVQDVHPPKSEADWKALKANWEKQLSEKVFAGWPAELHQKEDYVERLPGMDHSELKETITELKRLLFGKAGEPREDPGNFFAPDSVKHGVSFMWYRRWNQDLPDMKLYTWVFQDADREKKPTETELVVLGTDDWTKYENLIKGFMSKDGDPSKDPEFAAIKKKVEQGTRVALFAPRGVGPTAWPEKNDTHIRRRFYLLGQTLEGMRVLDARRAVRGMTAPNQPPLIIVGNGEAAPIALWAAVYEPERISKVVLTNPPATVRDGPAFLNLDRVMTMPQVVSMLYPREVEIIDSPVEAWSWPRTLAKNLGADHPWPVIKPAR